MPPRRGALHHLELWVPDLERAVRDWGWLLEALGYEPYQDWSEGRSWRSADSYVVVAQPAVLRNRVHDRVGAGMNHVAFHAGTRDEVDDLSARAQQHGWTLMFADKHPFAGGPDHYAAYLSDADGYEVELVAHP